MTAAKIFSDEASTILDRAISGVLSRNALLYFAYADIEEGRLKYDKVHQMYNKFVSIPDIDPTLVTICFNYLIFLLILAYIISNNL